MTDIYEVARELIVDAVESWVLAEDSWFYESEEPFEYSFEDLALVVRDTLRHLP